MLLKLLVVIASLTFVLADTNPRKLYKTKDIENIDGDIVNDVQIAPFKDPFDDIDYRLPNNTRPIHYDIWLKTDIDQGELGFSGRVSIHIEALENTNEITLHYRQLTIMNIDLLRSTGGSIQSNVPYTKKDDVEFLVIKPSARLIENANYTIVISYIGQLRSDDAGFYRSSYTDESGNKKWLATTQFESTDARHAFPW